MVPISQWQLEKQLKIAENPSLAFDDAVRFSTLRRFSNLGPADAYSLLTG